MHSLSGDDAGRNREDLTVWRHPILMYRRTGLAGRGTVYQKYFSGSNYQAVGGTGKYMK